MSPKFKNYSYKSRIYITSLLIISLSGGVAARLFFLQVIEYPFYRDLAQRQHSFSRILEPRRGDIYFKTKEGAAVRAATTKAGGMIYLNLKLLKDPDGAFAKLSKITPIDKELFYRLAQRTEDPYEILKHRISVEEAEQIASLNIPGIGVSEERWRFYPAGSLASHVVGFVSEAEEKPEGQYGIEKSFNEFLKGTAGKISGDEDARGILIALGKQLKTDPQEGESALLTIEPTVQRTIEEELGKLVLQWKAKGGGIIVVQPKTGRITALAAKPDFNPNQYNKEKDLGVFLNPFTEKIFEMGSVFKPLTMASAIDQGAVTPDTAYVDRGEIKIGSAVIKNFDGKARGERNMSQVLEESLNTGAVFAMQRLGGEKLKEYFYNFGLGEKSGVELPGELKGDLSNLDSGREIEFATASFGQGIAVTPLGLAMALSAVANGGKLLKPSVVDDGNAGSVVRQVIKPETAETITKMLVDVVDTTLAGGKAKMEHLSIAAKTGTAQIPNPHGKGYSDAFLHSFFGYFPAYDPDFLILMFLERPQGVKYASQSLTDTFRTLVEFLINYYTIPPDR